jgi:hypothetical protein
MVELLSMGLDFLDALAGAVAIACWWCTWVSPNRQAPRLRTKGQPSEGPEIDRFLVEVRSCAEHRPDAAAAGDLVADAVDADADALARNRNRANPSLR